MYDFIKGTFDWQSNNEITGKVVVTLYRTRLNKVSIINIATGGGFSGS